MTDPNHESDEALLEALGGRARERLERGTAALQDMPTRDPDAFSEEDLASVTEAVLKRTAGAANERPRSVALLVVAAATIAAALLLWFAIDRAPDPAPLVVRYQGTFVGGLKATRDASATTTDIARLRPDSPFSWTLVPETAIDEAVDVRLEAVSQGETRCLEVPTEEL
ncbi:MAG: DUF3995 domain-containing protein, partial [Nannocystaceae bacterium]|nr:DUF3995 domain-containing protein [Nannocystaceae bacterium]